MQSKINPMEDTLWTRCFNKCFLQAVENGDTIVDFETVNKMVLDLAHKPVIPMLVELGLVQNQPPKGEGDAGNDETKPDNDSKGPA